MYFLTPNYMYTLEAKTIDNKPYFYAIRRVKVGTTTKKIRVYIGKSAPKTKQQERKIISELQSKELALVPKMVEQTNLPDSHITNTEYEGLERARIIHHYAYGILTKSAQVRWWRNFAVRFIFESNAIEGSRLSETEVSAIVTGKSQKKTSNRNEIREVENAIEAMELIRGGSFVLNERMILKLHKLVTRDLGIAPGFKKREVVVNNKPTTPPGHVRKDLSLLLKWWKEEKNMPSFFKAVHFHRQFEAIHPFEDGNGRTGRFLLLWMLIKAGYDVILFKYSRRRVYFSALSKADDGVSRAWFRHAMRVYRDTMEELWGG